MKAFILQKIASDLSSKKFIKKALRVDNNVILLEVDKTKYFFDLTKSNSDIYINIEYEITKKFNAPFDLLLMKKFTKSKILEVRAVERILIIKVETNLVFKKEINYLQFEFTGKYTNAIILDENFVVQEALHHITSNQSFREVKVGEKLLPLPKKEIKEKVFEIDDLEKYTQKLFEEKYTQKINNIKTALISKIDKKIKKLKSILNNLDSEENLLKKAELYKKYADLAMINLHKINKYDKILEVEDFDGNKINIPIPKLHNINEIGNYYYNLSKKMKQKAKNISIEKENLKEKIDYLNNYKSGILKAKKISELNILKSNKKDKVKDDDIETFYVDDFVVLVGKNKKGNQKLLQTSKANDLWFHIKDMPGSHVIIKTNKSKVPEDVIYKVAKLALMFSNKDEGIVDYTQRRNVKPKNNDAYVNYTNYKSVKVKL